MSDYFGDIRLGDTIDIKFTTRQISGAPFTLAGSPVISAYPANSTTQLTAGITLSIDFDAVTGYNNVRVVASSGNGYLTATNYDLCITTGTVNSVSVVGESIGSFSIENRSALMPATAARTLVVDASGLADANAVKLGPTGSGTAQTARDIGASVLLSNGTGTGQLKLASGYVAMTWADIAAPTTSVNLSGTTIATTQKVDIDTIKTNPVVNAGTITFPTTATLASTTNITAGTIATVTNLTNAPTNGDFTATMKTSAQTAADAAITANALVLEIEADTDTLTGFITVAPPTASANADALLARNIAGGSSSGRIVTDALRFLRNKWSVTGTTLTVTQEDDTTSAWTATISTDAAALPITGSDPA